MEREERTPLIRYIVGFTLLPFRIIGYFLKNVVWEFLSRKKSFIEWSLLILSIVVVALLVTAIIYGDFKPTKSLDDDLSRGKKVKQH
jgi:hypothetical protein